MMKRVFLSMVSLGVAVVLFAQSIDDAKKEMYYQHYQKSGEILQKLAADKPGDAEANYWLGQWYLERESFDRDKKNLAKAREVYEKAMEATKQDPLIMVGMGHVELLEKKNDEARKHFDAAIEATRSRKNQKLGDPAILAAIGRANADGDSQTGDPLYGIERLKEAQQLNPTDPDIPYYLGISHLKRGGEYGGEAKRAFESVLDIDPNNARALTRIGKIFESQRNVELYMDYYGRATNRDPKYAPGHLAMYEYYANRDVNKAKESLDQYIANAEADCETDYFYADYLFRAGQYQESLNKGKEIEQKCGGTSFPKVYKLYAFDYDRLGDSIKAVQNMEKYMQSENPSKITGDDYSMMAAAYLKVPGNAGKAESMTEKAVAMDTSLDNKLQYMKSLADGYAAQKDWKGQYKWLDRMMGLRADTTARNYFFLADAAYKAGEYDASQRIASMYIRDFPEQSQGYYLKWRSAIAADPDTTKGSAIPAVDEYTNFLMQDTVKNKARIIQNHGYKIYYYLVKAQDYQKALESADAILAIDPNNNYGAMAKSEAERLIKATSPNGSGARSGSSGSKSGSSSSGGQDPN